MPHPLSALGVIHTAVSLLPIVAGLYGLVRHRAIDPATRAGKLYLLGLVLSVATSFTVSSTGGLNPGHAFGVIVLLVAFGGVLAARLRFLGRAARYLSTFALSFSFLLSLVPGVNETLTRIPVAHPIAAAPMAPVVLQTLLGCFVVFVLGFIAQCWRMRGRR
ncbi:hypothetical protein ABE583_06010 [Stenotrophomonas sp. TWI143]|uniref:hypothetical protein n=1 Tax=Stenotrophomonas TaxID=40323 RepID=UPI0018766588|nr:MULTISPECIES: hypothetical protein [Stenotrophomonas]MBE5270610.1 hypothetical protein [Stenotrophomonas sp. B2]UXY49830.1 hypothetical protein N8888_07880 [Stenotrophomonas maltophilia]HDS1220709.1 hypothetical protein [Stenotrophomonas maltophilia]HDS1232144.1 hypothetical protein [Stenotrophomonas maltophilia]HEL7629328.1 hypothetical protein [Stenotrophomonas maltophilia]